MSYIGNEPTTAHFPHDIFSGDASTVDFTLTQFPGSASAIDVYVGRVWQVPSSGYTVSGSTLTFTSAPPTGTNNIDVVHKGVQVQVPTPADASVTAAKLSTGQFGGDYIKLSDTKTSGTDGGSSSATTTHVRVLNTEEHDTGNNCSLVSNQFTLAAGTYQIQASAPAYKSEQTKIRLYNVTDAVYEIEGQSTYFAASNTVGGHATLQGAFTIATSKTFELRHYITTAQATSGLGAGVAQGDEVYAVVELWKVK